MLRRKPRNSAYVRYHHVIGVIRRYGMSVTSSSPRAVALEALAAGEAALPAYSHPCSPRQFTQPQLFACLVLKAFFKTDYRGGVAILSDWDGLAPALGRSACALHHAAGGVRAAARLRPGGGPAAGDGHPVPRRPPAPGAGRRGLDGAGGAAGLALLRQAPRQGAGPLGKLEPDDHLCAIPRGRVGGRLRRPPT